MKRALVYLGLGVLAVCGSDARPGVADHDHLVPADGIIQSDYYALLKRKLFVTPSDFARIVDLQSGATEEVVAIYTGHTPTDENVQITYTTPDKDLWEAGSDSQFRFVKDPAVSVTRIDAPFPKPVAVAVSAAVKHLLAERRPPVAKPEEVIVHGRMVEVSVASGKQQVRGLLPPYARAEKGHSLRRLTDLLQRYCHAPAVDRPKLSQEIASEARKIARYKIRRKA